MKSNINKLMVGAFVGLIGCFQIKRAFDNKLSEKLKSSPHFNQVSEEVRNHKGAIKFLGEPIEWLRAKVNTEPKWPTSEQNIKVYVKGPLSNGTVYYSVYELDGKPKLDYIHLQLNQDTSRRLVIKKSEKTQSDNMNYT